MSSILHVEILQREMGASKINLEKVKEIIKHKIGQHIFLPGQNISNFKEECLESNVESICLSDLDIKDNKFKKIRYYFYYLHPAKPELETMETNCESEGDICVASHWILPSYEFHELWDHLFYDNNIKENLLSYVETTMLFSNQGVNTNIISLNRVVLLHGPPGTGKTSLCKALAHKLAIRQGHNYTHQHLYEINSHSLFSKWFSESGKLVMKMFNKIQFLLEDPNALVCILIDEVESLSCARQSSLAGTDPTDSMRVVNALLTQLDQIKRFPNVLILTTSNILEAIDLAFIDRADIKQYIGPPSLLAIYKIYNSCISELQRTSIINTGDILCPPNELDMNANVAESSSLSQELLQISRKSNGLSGRSLRKIPFLAHSNHIRTPTASLGHFLSAMQKEVSKLQEEMKK